MDFEWDSGNVLKSLNKHGISIEESEQVFGNPYLLLIDESHSSTEMRFRLLGSTDDEKILFVVFTTRKNKIRVISARLANRNERKIYEEKI